jgi:hypothetical protein
LSHICGNFLYFALSGFVHFAGYYPVSFSLSSISWRYYRPLMPFSQQPAHTLLSIPRRYSGE